MRKSIRRLLRHLTRSRARVGWLLFGFCVLVYLFVPANVAKEFALVLAGVAARRSSCLSCRATSGRCAPRTSARRCPTCGSVSCGGNSWRRPCTSGAATSSSGPRSSNRCCRRSRGRWPCSGNPSYDVHLYLDQPIMIADGRVTIHRLETTSRSERILPATDGARIWVSLAPETRQALVSEFGKEGCLLRELVDLPDIPKDSWRREVLKHCLINISVNGEPLPLETPEGENVDVIRWEAPVPRRGTGVRPDEPVPIMVSAQFPLSADVSTFP